MGMLKEFALVSCCFCYLSVLIEPVFNENRRAVYVWYCHQAKIQKEEAKKVAVHVDENVPAPSPRCNASVNPFSSLNFFLFFLIFSFVEDRKITFPIQKHYTLPICSRGGLPSTRNILWGK
jgi:hypothetical protein